MVAAAASETLGPTIGLAVFLPGLDGFVQAHGMGEKDGVPVAALASRWQKMLIVKLNISHSRKFVKVFFPFEKHATQIQPDRKGTMMRIALIQRGVVIESDPHPTRGDMECGCGGD